MKTKTLTFITAFSTLAFTLLAHAHDPKKPMQDTERLDCTLMEKMDHSKMDMETPVRQAMIQQCMNTMNNDKKPESESEGGSNGDELAGHKH